MSNASETALFLVERNESREPYLENGLFGTNNDDVLFSFRKGLKSY